MRWQKGATDTVPGFTLGFGVVQKGGEEILVDDQRLRHQLFIAGYNPIDCQPVVTASNIIITNGLPRITDDADSVIASIASNHFRKNYDTSKIRIIEHITVTSANVVSVVLSYSESDSFDDVSRCECSGKIADPIWLHLKLKIEMEVENGKLFE